MSFGTKTMATGVANQLNLVSIWIGMKVTKFTLTDKHPMIYVSWNEATAMQMSKGKIVHRERIGVCY